MIPLKTEAEIEAIGRAGAIIAEIFDVLPLQLEPGVTTASVDELAESTIRAYDGAEPAFKGLYGFPATACISINEEVVHGIPRSERVLRAGDIVTVDVGVELDGWYADAARTFPIGEVDDESARLLKVTREALEHGIAAAVPGNRLGDVGHRIERVAEEAGFSIVRELVGHGIGRSPHEEPQVPNFGSRGRGVEIQAGMVLAIEPMVNLRGEGVRTLEDRWTVVTADGARSAHFEQTVAILEDGPRVLTAR